MELEREIPAWEGILAANKFFGVDGWCVAFADVQNPLIETTSDFKQIDSNKYRDTININCNGTILQRSRIYSLDEPSWTETYPVKNLDELDTYIRTSLSDKTVYDFTDVNYAHEKAGEDILVELDLGGGFSDMFSTSMGYEETLLLFMSDNDTLLDEYYDMFIHKRLDFIRQACNATNYESFFIGSDVSHCSLLGPTLWRKWEKPYFKAIVDEAHKLGKHVHLHSHGKIMDIVPDLAEIGFDCVCPFERAPGDVNGIEGLKKVRKLLNEKVTFNGNVHTMNTMIFGTPDDVRREVREIKEAFGDTPRLIIGSGDQVTHEAPEENIYAMLEEGRK